jgi:hypothetical protein
MFRCLARPLGGLLLCVASAATAQTTPGPGRIAGRVTDPSGLPVPGVVVTAAGPAVGPARSVRTSPDGRYLIDSLKAGGYKVTFDIVGFVPWSASVSVPDGGSAELDARLELAPFPETVRVTSERRPGEPESHAPAGGVVAAETIDLLPVARTPEDAALMVPGISATGANNALAISGAFSFGNVFLVDGFAAQDVLRGQGRPFYIAEAVAETRVSTGAVPIEFGRFQGGVVSTVTKSGGNAVSGSVRVGISNDDWRSLTPYRGDATLNRRVPAWEFTLGGPIVKNRLFAFGAGQLTHTEQNRTLAYTQRSYPYDDREQRYQAKVTWTVRPTQTLRVDYFGIRSTRANVNAGTVLDLASLYDTRTPEWLLGAAYSTTIGRRLLLDARVSTRRLRATGIGASATDLVAGTPVWDRSRSDARFNSPTGCAVCPDSADDRDNRNAAVTLSWGGSGVGPGSHALTTGVDVFQESRQTNTYQSGSGYRVRATRATLLNDQVFPVFLADRTTWIYWTPIQQPSVGNDMRTYSVFAGDTWRASRRVTVQGGVRADLNHDTDSQGALAVKDTAVSPRVLVSWNPDGRGAWIIRGGYARYVSSVNTTITDMASPGGRPSTYVYDYLGPVVNSTGTAVATADALRTLFTWFQANGGTTRATRSAPTIPGLTVRMDPALDPLDAQELLAGISRQFGGRGAVRVDGVFRRYGSFYGNRRDLTTGKVVDAAGALNDVQIVTNVGAGARRTYQGLQSQMLYRLGTRTQVTAVYTLAWTRGNVDGESGTAGPEMAPMLDYPEYREARWNSPDGSLASDQRHRLRAYVLWDARIPARYGRVSVGVVQRVESGVPWSAIGNINPQAYVVNPGYARPPSSVQYYFSARGAYHTDTVTATDLSCTWTWKVAGTKRTQVYARGALMNVFNEAAVQRMSRTVITRIDNTAYAAFNPFTETPVQGVHYAYGADFGKPTSPNDYQAPREFTLALGVRF